MDKLEKLRSILKNMGSLLLAYSGGVDSAFLLRVSYEVLADKALAVTAVSATYPEEELESAKRIAVRIGAKHKIIKTVELKNRNFTDNSINRCYFCKRELFSKLKKLAGKNRIRFVADASNSSDKEDFRPGNLARKELGIRSPLVEAGFSKDDIRRYSKKLGLVTWDKPSLACLASRIPYGFKITPQVLQRIDKGELILRKIGFTQVRLRSYDGLCRIEVPEKEIPALLKNSKLVVERLKGLGYNYITVDLEGYRTGSMNPVRNARKEKLL